MAAAATGVATAAAAIVGVGGPARSSALQGTALAAIAACVGLDRYAVSRGLDGAGLPEPGSEGLVWLLMASCVLVALIGIMRAGLKEDDWGQGVADLPLRMAAAWGPRATKTLAISAAATAVGIAVWSTADPNFAMPIMTAFAPALAFCSIGSSAIAIRITRERERLGRPLRSLDYGVVRGRLNHDMPAYTEIGGTAGLTGATVVIALASALSWAGHWTQGAEQNATTLATLGILASGGCLGLRFAALDLISKAPWRWDRPSQAQALYSVALIASMILTKSAGDAAATATVILLPIGAATFCWPRWQEFRKRRRAGVTVESSPGQKDTARLLARRAHAKLDRQGQAGITLGIETAQEGGVLRLWSEPDGAPELMDDAANRAADSEDWDVNVRARRLNDQAWEIDIRQSSDGNTVRRRIIAAPEEGRLRAQYGPSEAPSPTQVWGGGASDGRKEKP